MGLTIKEVAEKYGTTADTLRYYEKVGMIPPVTRNRSGVRDYCEEDLKWVELALCMRTAGLPVEVMIEYLKLFRAGPETISQRLELLTKQRETLLKQRENIDTTLERLAVKIERYEEAMKTGKLVWDTAKEFNEEMPKKVG